MKLLIPFKLIFYKRNCIIHKINRFKCFGMSREDKKLILFNGQILTVFLCLELKNLLLL